jgi:parallel beta-helix repeat protein
MFRLEKGEREMSNRTFSAIVMYLLVLGTIGLVFGIQPVRAIGTIYIRADGSIDPPTAPIYTTDNITYTMTGNITYDGIVVERDNIVVDGAGYSLEGMGSGDGIYLFQRSNVTIKNMEIRAFSYGIWAAHIYACTISRNNIRNNQQDGIRLHSSSNGYLSGNTIMNNTDGIWCWSGCDYNCISGNNITANKLLGIFIWRWCKNNTIHGNHVTVNGWEQSGGGIALDSYSDPSSYNIVCGNHVANNPFGVLCDEYYDTISENYIVCNEYGLWWGERAGHGTICGNSIANNTYGVYLSGSSSDNKIYHNNLISNTVQALDPDPILNLWYNPYLLEGNYWSDYCGKDDGSGSGKHSIAGDGIGDTLIPHPDIDYDFYPLMKPWSPQPPSTPPVGGEWVPINKLQLLTPWIGLLSLMTVLTMSLVYVRRKRRQN